MKHIKYIVYFVLLSTTLLVRYLDYNLFQKIKSHFEAEISLYRLSFIYANIGIGDTDVSLKEEIIVKDFQKEESYYVVMPLNNEVRLPFSGLITKKNHDFITFEVAYDVIFYLALDNSSVLLYEPLAKNEKLGISSTYKIWSNKDINLKLLNYTKNFDEA